MELDERLAEKNLEGLWNEALLQSGVVRLPEQVQLAVVPLQRACLGGGLQTTQYRIGRVPRELVFERRVARYVLLRGRGVHCSPRKDCPCNP